MADDAGTLLVKLRADIAEMKSQLSEGRSDLADFKTSAQEAGEAVKSALTFVAGAIGIYEIGSALKSAFKQGIEAVNEFQLTTIGIAATIADMAKDQTKGQQNYNQALAYSKDMYQELELAAAHHFASGQELVQGWNIMAQKGIILRKEEIDSLGIIVDRIKLATQGQVSSIQIAQELRGIMDGQARATDQVARLLKDKLGPAWTEVTDAVRKSGSLKPLADQFEGLAYANKDIEASLQAQRSTLATLLTQVGRAGLQGAYEDIVKWISDANEYLKTHRNEIAGPIMRGWKGVKDLAQGVYGFVKEMADIGKKGIVIPITFSIGNLAKILSSGGIAEGGTYLAGGQDAGLGLPGISARKVYIPPTSDFGFGALLPPTRDATPEEHLAGLQKQWGKESDVLGEWGEFLPPTTTPGKGGKEGKGGEKSRVSVWQAELEAMKEAEGAFFNFSKDRELEFWKEKLAIAKEGGKGEADEATQINHRIFALQKEMHKDALQQEIASLKLQQESAKTDGAERLRLQDEILKKIAASYGKDSKEYIQAQEQRVKIARQVEADLVKIEEERIKKVSELNKVDLDMARENASFKTKMGVQTEAQEIRELIALKNQEFLIERKAINDKLLLLKQYGMDKTKEYKKTQGELEVLEKKHDLDMLKLNNQLTLALKAQWGQLWDSISRAFTMSLQGIITGTTTLKDALNNLWQSILSSFVEMIGQIVLKWIAGQLMMLIFGQASDKMSAVSSVSSSAAKAGAAGFASVMAALPFPFNMIVAPAVGGAAAAETMSFLSIASAAGGWDVPEDTLALIHKREMVLPATLADQVRSGTTGKASGPINFTFAPNINYRMTQAEWNAEARKMAKALNRILGLHGKAPLGPSYA